MAKSSRLCSLLLTLAVLLALLPAPASRAAGTVPLRLPAEYDADARALRAVVSATESITLSNYDFLLDWDRAVFALSGAENGQASLLPNFLINTDSGSTGCGRLSVMSAGSDVTVPAGETLVTYTLTAAGIPPAGAYGITLTVKSVSDQGGDALPWRGGTVTASAVVPGDGPSSLPLSMAAEYDAAARAMTVAVTAAESITLANFDLLLGWDQSAFALSGAENGQASLLPNFLINTDSGSPRYGRLSAMSAGSDVTLPAGETLVTYTLTELGTPPAGTYTVTLTAKSASDQEGAALPWRGASAACSVSAVPVTEFRLNKNSAALRIGDTETLTLSILPENALSADIDWSSSNPAIASVSPTGTVTAVSTGTASIVATAGRFTAVCVVTVSEAVVNVTGVTLNVTELPDMEIGSSRTLSATVLPESATNRSLRWTSSDPGVVVVSNGGVVSAVGPGSAVITVTTDDGGYSATCRVTVLQRRAIERVEAVLPAASVTVQGSPLNTAGLTVTAFYTDGTSSELTGYSISGYDPANTLPGQHTLTVTVQDPENSAITYTASFTATVVERETVGISVAQKPTKRSYAVGEAFDPSGMRVVRVFGDGSSEALAASDYRLEGFSSQAAGTVTVTVRWGSFTDSFTVSIYSAASSEVTAPMISIESFYGGKRVQLSAAAGCDIRYTTDGTDPTLGSPLYDPANPLELTETTSLRAVAYLNGVPSRMSAARITVTQVLPPVPSHTADAAPENGVYAPMQVPAGTVVTLRSETSGSAIYYTVDGSDPDVNSLLYGSSIVVNTSVTIKAAAVKHGFKTSEICEIRYEVPQSDEQTEEAVISLGSVTAKAGDMISLPVYILSASPVNEFRFTLRYDSSAFSYRSVTPTEGMNAAELLVGADDARGEVTLMYSGEGLDGGEMFTLNLEALASDLDGDYTVEVSDSQVVKVKTDSGVTVMVSVSAGRITLSGSANSLLSGSVTFLNTSDGTELDSADHVSDDSEVTANVELEGAADELGVLVNVYLVVYNRRGAMSSMDTWEVEVSNMGTAFMQTIRIPRNVDVGAVKLIILSDDNVPLMMSGLL